MNSLAPIVIVLALASAYGFWHKSSQGRIRTKSGAGKGALTAAQLGAPLGSRVTLLQFSTVFCAPCRATRSLLEDITSQLPDVAHIHLDAESNLELVRELDIRSTPTTLILNAAGVEVGRAVGAPKREQVLKSLAQVQ